MNKQVLSADEYIDQFEGEVRSKLIELRKVVKKETPDAVEGISYGLVGYKLYGKPLVYFGGFPHHVGFYATPSGHEAFKGELSKYKQGKGSVQFPLGRPLPISLVRRMIAYRRDLINETKGGYA